MLKPKIEKALNHQINAELYSAYLYLGMMNYFKSKSLDGFANWMNVQVMEELSHAEKFIYYVHERGGSVNLLDIEKPEQEWDSPLHAFEKILSHEQYVTKRINELLSVAIEEKDFATQNFLQWFISEQVEEEASASQIVEQLKMINETHGGIFMLDRELAQRKFTPIDGGN